MLNAFQPFSFMGPRESGDLSLAIYIAKVASPPEYIVNSFQSHIPLREVDHSLKH